MKVSLRSLIHHHAEARAVSAGWLPGDDAAVWLAERASCERQARPVRMFAVAVSAADPRCAGAFLVPVNEVPAFGPRVIPLGRLAPGVHGPCDAELTAGLTEREQTRFFPHEVHLFHPSLGVVGFDEEDAVDPADLIVMPPAGGDAWDHALRPSEPPRLKRLLVALPMDPDEGLEQAGQEIGDQSGKLKGLPGGLGGKAAMIGGGLLGGALVGLGRLFSEMGIGSGSGRGAGSGKPPSKLGEWAERQWQDLASARQRELSRLMDLLQKDPDQGLRYALPLTGDGSRGKAPASGLLGMRNVRFGMGGGGTADVWNIDHQVRLKLERQYREAAKREEELGRFDRAAYILGNLLGDWAGAASMLRRAGRHRDAAAIYIHKLHNKREAARCFEEAGMLLQAADLYREAGEFEKAGDLHARLGNPTEAQRLWREAVASVRDPLEKARILAAKLNDRGRALNLLDGQWPTGNGAAAILRRMFDLLHEMEAEDRAKRLFLRVMERVPEPPGLKLEAKLRLGLAERGRWSSEGFGALVGTEVWSQVARVAADGAPETPKLLALLPVVEPDDFLLRRDVQRYAVPKREIRLPWSGRLSGNLKPSAVVPIPLSSVWQSVAAFAGGVSVVGHGDGMLTVGQYRGQVCNASALRTGDDPGGRCAVRHWMVNSERGSSRLIHFPGHGRLHYRALDRTRNPDDDAIGALRRIHAAGVVEGRGEFLVLEYTRTSSLSLHVYTEIGTRQQTLALDLAPPEVIGQAWFCGGRDSIYCVATHGLFGWRHDNGEFSTEALAGAVSRLEVSPDGTPMAVLLVAGGEVLVTAPRKPGKGLETVNLHATAGDFPPVACFLSNGSVVIIEEREGMVFAPGEYLHPSATFELPPGELRAADVCRSGPGGFVVLTSGGTLVEYR